MKIKHKIQQEECSVFCFEESTLHSENLMGPGQNPGEGFRWAKPTTENGFLCLRCLWRALRYSIL